jgi:type IV secretion system protein TrbG
VPMTHDVTPPPAPRLAEPSAGPDVVGTDEWTLADLPWVTPDELLEPGALPATSPGPGANAKPPPPPSRSERPARHGAFVAGAAAPDGAERTAKPLITLPKQRQPKRAPEPAIAPDLGATLPPRAERSPPMRAAEAQAVTPPQATLTSSVRRSQRAFVALGVLVACTLGYAVWGAVLNPIAADAATPRELPKFLQETVPSDNASTGAPPPAPPVPTPPSEATLTAALAPDPSLGTPTGADAGAPQASTALAEETAARFVDPASPSAIQRADTSPATLQGAPRMPPKRSPAGTPPSGAIASPRRAAKEDHTQRARRQPIERAEIRVPRTRAPAAVRPLTTYTFEEKALFAVATAPMRVTDLVLERGERLASQPTAGDAARWVVSVVATAAQTHVFVKPLRAGLRTNLTLTTDRRTYFLELSSSEDGSYMAGVEWSYPSDDAARRREALARAERERHALTAVSDLQALRFDYEIRATPGARAWTPTLVFDDGLKTFIRFRQPVAAASAPILLISRSGTTRDAKYVNYRVKGDLYVIDRLIDAAELRLPNDEDGQDIVRITRRH